MSKVADLIARFNKKPAEEAPAVPSSREPVVTGGIGSIKARLNSRNSLDAAEETANVSTSHPPPVRGGVQKLWEARKEQREKEEAEEAIKQQSQNDAENSDNSANDTALAEPGRVGKLANIMANQSSVPIIKPMDYTPKRSTVVESDEDEDEEQKEKEEKVTTDEIADTAKEQQEDESEHQHEESLEQATDTPAKEETVTDAVITADVVDQQEEQPVSSSPLIAVDDHDHAASESETISKDEASVVQLTSSDEEASNDNETHEEEEKKEEKQEEADTTDSSNIQTSMKDHPDTETSKLHRSQTAPTKDTETKATSPNIASLARVLSDEAVHRVKNRPASHSIIDDDKGTLDTATPTIRPSSVALPGMALPGLANLGRVLSSDKDSKTGEEGSDVAPEPTGPLKPLGSQFNRPANRGRRLPTRVRKTSGSSATSATSGKSDQSTTVNDEKQEDTPELVVESLDQPIKIVTEEPDEDVTVQDTNTSNVVDLDAVNEPEEDETVSTKPTSRPATPRRSTTASASSHQRTASASSSTSSIVSRGHRSSKSATLKKSDIPPVSSNAIKKSSSQSSTSSSNAGKKRATTLDPSSRLYAPTASSAAKQRAPITKSNSVGSRHDGRLSPLPNHGSSSRRSLSRSPSRMSMRSDDGYDSNDS